MAAAAAAHLKKVRGKHTRSDRSSFDGSQDGSQHSRSGTGADDSDDALSGDEENNKISIESNSKRVYGQPIDFVWIDNPSSLKKILKRYDALYWIFHEAATYPGSKEFSVVVKAARFLLKPYPEGRARVPREEVLETGYLNWCVAGAFAERSDYIGKIQEYNNSSALVAAMLLVVVSFHYILPPEFDDDSNGTLFADITTGLLGLSTFIQLFNMVGFISIVKFINQPHVPSLVMFARVEADFYLSLLGVFVYLGVAFFMAAVLVLAYVGSTWYVVRTTCAYICIDVNIMFE